MTIATVPDALTRDAVLLFRWLGRAFGRGPVFALIKLDDLAGVDIHLVWVQPRVNLNIADAGSVIGPQELSRIQRRRFIGQDGDVIKLALCLPFRLRHREPGRINGNGFGSRPRWPGEGVEQAGKRQAFRQPVKQALQAKPRLVRLGIDGLFALAVLLLPPGRTAYRS